MPGHPRTPSPIEKWPKGWTQRRQGLWVAKGGTRELAIQLHALGWTAHHLAQQIRRLDALAEVSAPTGGRTLHEMLGDDLVTLLNEGGPALRQDALVTWSRRSPTGRREVWQVRRGAGGVGLTRHSQEARGAGWTTDTEGLAALGADTWLSDLTDLLALSGHVITHIATGPDGPSPTTVLTQLRVDGQADATEWDGEEITEQLAEDADIADLAEGLAWSPVWAYLDGQRITGIAIETDAGSDVEPVAIDLWTPALISLRPIATSSWFSEGGGALVSWDGGTRLAQITRTLGIDEQWGDLGSEVTIFRLPATVTELADRIVTWILDRENEVAAALALEELDPDGRLSQAERDQWTELIDAVTADVTLGVEQPVIELVRHHMTQDVLYARVKRALEDPAGASGRDLRQVLTVLAASGVVGDLLRGNWG